MRSGSRVGVRVKVRVRVRVRVRARVSAAERTAGRQATGGEEDDRSVRAVQKVHLDVRGSIRTQDGQSPSESATLAEAGARAPQGAGRHGRSLLQSVVCRPEQIGCQPQEAGVASCGAARVRVRGRVRVRVRVRDGASSMLPSEHAHVAGACGAPHSTRYVRHARDGYA